MKPVNNLQHYLFHLNFWVVDVDACTFFHQIIGDGYAWGLSVSQTSDSPHGLLSYKMVKLLTQFSSGCFTLNSFYAND